MTVTRRLPFPVPAFLAIGAAVLVTEAWAAPAVPVVYQDGNVLVRAGVAEAGSEAIHLGDAFSFSVEVEFDAGAVRIEMPDDEWFQRSLAGVTGLRLYESVTIADEQPTGGRVRVTSRWRLQALDCPEGEPSCPGPKTFDLPVMTIDYQLTGGTGADSRSARFRPWPGQLSIAPSIAEAPGPDSTLTDLLPGGAHAPVIDAGLAPPATGWLLAAGALLLLLGFVPPPRMAHAERAARRVHHAQTRWEQTLARLEAGSYDDEQWADHLRHAVNWYCLDELGVNPYSWLGPAGRDNVPADAETAAWREFFLEVLEQHDIAGDSRRAWLGRFRRLNGEASAAA